jgi:hypothetical protein
MSGVRGRLPCHGAAAQFGRARDFGAAKQFNFGNKIATVLILELYIYFKKFKNKKFSNKGFKILVRKKRLIILLLPMGILVD